jgi:hypothetical protein
MASTYVNDLRLNEMATGDGSGTWGTTTNTNLELIAEAFSYGTEVITTNADTHTTTIADGATDPGRSLYLKYTGTLDSACTITIGPNTVSKVWIIENGTSGSQNIIISQGSGANITIPAGDTKVVYSDGAGAGAAFVDAFASLSVVDLKVQDDLTVTDDASIGGDATITGTLGVTGNITGTLATAAQPNITSVGTLTGFTSTGIDDNADATAITIDSSENVGIGNTSPSAKFTNYKNTSISGSAGATLSLELNTEPRLLLASDSSTSYISSFDGNPITFSVTAGNFSSSTGTERMRIDPSGSLLHGTTSSSIYNETSGDGVNIKGQSGQIIIAKNSTSSADPALWLNNTGVDGSIATFAKDGAVVGSIGTGASELFIGSNDAYLWTSGNNNAFLPASTVIGGASDGLLDLGSSSRYFKDLYLVKLDIAGGSSLDGNYAFFKSSSATVTSLTLRKDSVAADSVDYLQCRNNANTLKLVIEGDGDVKNTNNSYGAVSDEKLKENIVDATSQWDDIKAVRVRKYSLKEHNLDSPNMLGVVAQELESAGMNGLVSESIDRNEDNEDLGTVTKSVNYSILYMKAVKALQEAMDRIETLEAKVETLENA